MRVITEEDAEEDEGYYRGTEANILLSKKSCEQHEESNNFVGLHSICWLLGGWVGIVLYNCLPDSG